MVRIVNSTALLVLCVFGMASLGLAKEFPLTRKELPLDAVTRQADSLGNMEFLTVTRPPNVTEPAATSKKPLYAYAPAGAKGGRKLLLRLDESKGTGKGYDRLIIDLNRNNDFKDDPVHTGKKQSASGEVLFGEDVVVFGPIEVPAETAGGKDAPAASVYVQASTMRRITMGMAGMAMILPACCLEAEVEFGGVKQKIALLDRNGNLNFADMVRGETGPMGFGGFEGDVLLRDCDGSGDYNLDEMERETEPLSPIVYFGATPCTLAVSADAKSIAIEPCTGPMGQVKIADGKPIRRFTLARRVSEKEWQLLAPTLVNGVAQLPEGSYCVASVILAAKDKQDVEYVGASQRSEMKPTLEVKAGQTLDLPIGPPVDVRIAIQRPGLLAALFAGPELRFNVTLLGAGGEQYLRFQKDGEALDPPSFKIRNDKDEVVESGQFEYG
jgi:hypothetical protein